MMQIPPVLTAVILALVLSQGFKIARIIFVHRQHFAFADLFVTGGMPSSHSAMVVALVVAIGLTEGISNLFVLSAVLAAIVIRDALGVRRTAGEEGKLLNRIISMAHFKVKQIHYSLGHTPAEVAVGCLIGALCGLVVVWL
jgi:hypothetical protein